MDFKLFSKISRKFFRSRSVFAFVSFLFFYFLWHGSSFYTSRFWRGISQRGKKNETEVLLDDVFMTVKTGHAYHKERLDLIFKTWLKKVSPEQVIFAANINSRL